jgi:DNA-binding response OmpR family regulator
VTHPRSAPTTVAILGTDALAEDILARLLEREGYSTRHLEAYPTDPMDERLDGVDVVLVVPGLKDRAREAFLEAVRSTQETAAIPMLTLPATLKLALLDELSAGASWRPLFEELVGQIGAVLQRAAAGAGALLVEGRTAEPPPSPPPAPQPDAL